MSARRSKREVVYQIDEIGGVTILDGGRFIGVADGAVMCLEIFKARMKSGRYWERARPIQFGFEPCFKKA